MKDCDVVSDNMVAYRDLYDKLEASFDGCELHHIGRASNEEADELANIGSTRAPIPPGVFLEQINERSIKIPRKAVKDLGAAPKGNHQDLEKQKISKMPWMSKSKESLSRYC